MSDRDEEIWTFIINNSAEVWNVISPEFYERAFELLRDDPRHIEEIKLSINELITQYTINVKHVKIGTSKLSVLYREKKLTNYKLCKRCRGGKLNKSVIIVKPRKNK